MVNVFNTTSPAVSIPGTKIDVSVVSDPRTVVRVPVTVSAVGNRTSPKKAEGVKNGRGTGTDCLKALSQAGIKVFTNLDAF